MKQRTWLVEISVSRMRILYELCSSVLEKYYCKKLKMSLSPKISAIWTLVRLKYDAVARTYKKYGNQHYVGRTAVQNVFLWNNYFGRYSLLGKELKFSAYSVISFLYTHTRIPFGVCSFHRFNESHFNFPYYLSLLEQQLKPLFPRLARIFMKTPFFLPFLSRCEVSRTQLNFFVLKLTSVYRWRL